MKFQPFKHQQMMVDHLVKNREALLFVGTGLGKTASVLAATDHLVVDGDMRGLLVVAPLRVSVLTWPDEVDKWATFSHLHTVSLRTKGGLAAWANKSACIYTINYESLPSFVDTYIKGKTANELPVDSVLFDEIDNAKNPSSKRINAFRKVARSKFKRAWGMTGTPTANSRLDLFSQVRLIDKGKTFGNAFHPWKTRFFEPENTYSNYPKFVLRKGADAELEASTAHLALVLKAQDWLDVPPTKTVDVPIALPTDAKKRYNVVKQEFLELLHDGFEVAAPNAAALIIKLQQITSGAVYATREEGGEKHRRVEVVHDAKIKALKNLHEKTLKRRPLLVACQFTHEIDRILEAFPEARKFENGLLASWNAGDIPMLVSHPKSISHGLNLQHGGSDVCWFSLGYSRGLYDQFNARLIRQGQTKKTTIWRLVAPGTVDDAIAGALRAKDEDQQAFLNTLKNIKKLAEAE